MGSSLFITETATHGIFETSNIISRQKTPVKAFAPWAVAGNAVEGRAP